MNLKDIPLDRPPIRGLQKEVAQLKKQIDQLEAENAWLRKILAETQGQDDKKVSQQGSKNSEKYIKY